MTARARVDIDVIYQKGDANTISVGSLTEHITPPVTDVVMVSGTVATSAVSIVGVPPLSTLAVKNAGNVPLVLAGKVEVPVGRMAILPVTATVTIAASSGVATYSYIWMG